MSVTSRSSKATILVLVCALALAILAGCHGKKGAAPVMDDPNFNCADRRIAYIATGGFAGPEVAVVADCAESGPRIKKWIVMDDAGTRKDGAHSLTGGEFDDLWEKIESTGWRNLGDCDQTEAREGEPLYRFSVANNQVNKDLLCAGKVLPFPFDRIANELDLLTAEYGL